MTEAEMEAAADGTPWSVFRAQFPEISAETLRRVHWRVKARLKRTRFLAKTGIIGRPRFQITPEFIADAGILSNADLLAKYNIGKTKLFELRRQIDVPSPVHSYRASLKEMPEHKPRNHTPGIVFDQRWSSLWSKRDTSLAGQAADYLRRYGPVVRCNADGRYDENGTHWRRNSSILTADEVIERAEANGFDARAWARLAA